MKKILEGSLLYRALSAVAAWLDRQWQKSCISLAFISSKRREAGGLMGALAHKVHMALCRVFEALRLNKLLEGSVFQRQFFWVALTVAAAPLLKTMMVLGLAVIATGSAIVNYGCDRDRRAVSSRLTKWVAAFAVIYTGSTLLSVNLRGSLLGGLLTTFFALFALVVLDTFRTREDLLRLLAVITLSAALVAGIGLLQVAMGVESSTKWIDEADFSNITLRVYSTLDNPNVLSEYFMLTIPIGVATAYTAKNLNGRLAAGVSVLIQLLCLVLTWSRGGWLGILAAAAVFLVIMDKRFLVLGILALAGFVAVMPESMIARFSSIGSMTDSSTSFRIYIWMGSLDMLRDYWLTGFGTGVAAYQSVYPRYAFNDVMAPHAHNLFLQIFCECGIGGLLVLLGVFYSAVRELGMAVSDAANKEEKVCGAALLASLAGFAVQSMTDHSFYNYRVELMFWVTVGVCGCLAMAARERRAAK